MTALPVGEDAWLAFVDEASRTASDLETRVAVVEQYKHAKEAQPWSLKLWLAYCEWFWSLHTDCQTADAGWPEEEQELGKELFTLDGALDIWEEAYKSIKYRLNDSHYLWNRWISIELEELAKSKAHSRSRTVPPAEVDRVRGLFLDRLQTPHATWDDTAQRFSTFLSEYDERSYESTMVEVTKLSIRAKQLYAARELHELKLANANNTGDTEAYKVAMYDYMDWENKQARIKPKKGQEASPVILCIALYERALCSAAFSFDAAIWIDYIVFIGQNPHLHRSATLSVLPRATAHCPSSGVLWARWILTAEAEGTPHDQIESIKHAATNADLDRDGMESVVEVYIAWCGYLLRRASHPGAPEEDDDLAHMGLASALESVQEWGRKLHGKEYHGDPRFRIERLMIQFLSQKGAVDEARTYWKKLVKNHADSYEFWQQYYVWEMTVRAPKTPPIMATGILLESVRRRTLDWPEKMMETYLRHCNIYADADVLVSGLDTVHIFSKLTAARREKEAADAAAIYAQQNLSLLETPTNESPGGSKRKRETTDIDGSAGKKVKTIAELVNQDDQQNQQDQNVQQDQQDHHEQHLKRDRENTTILVMDLPSEVTQTKVRQYFKDYGHINSIVVKPEPSNSSSTALIEFRSNLDVLSALLRDGKYFGSNQIHVKAATGFTLYVTNYPPTADDTYIKNLFKQCGDVFSIRWPSLKFNPHRRFCYVTFRDQESAAKATELHGQMLLGGFKLSALYSNPAVKKAREGAMAEGRELHVTGLDKTLKESEVKGVFSKYGPVENIRILKTGSGENKGAGFIVFEKKEHAEAALALHETKLKSRVLSVEISTGKNFKQTATSKGTSASPATDADGDSVMSPASAPEGASRTDNNGCTITLLNIPDTVNDARVRVIAEPYGTIVKLVLHPKHQGAIIEYVDAQTAGRAALGLENYEITPGRKLRTGGLKDLYGEKEEIKSDRVHVGKAKEPKPTGFIQPVAPVRRPGGNGRGGLGTKRGLGYAGVKPSSSSAGAGNGEGNTAKSNADFRAMFVQGKTQ
ncbi:hypothetical protein B0O99DRAFT_523118 [Bisporella sp. PMI_857]|nr:hypothetical protein B0O99DRAFT_523118 [Bisporella sp. PMI_857]